MGLTQTGTDGIKADAVTGAKIADDAIDSEHLVDGSIDTAHIGADQITGAKIADDAIDSEHIADGSIDTAHIAADQITGAKIADDAIDSEHIADGAVATAPIADGNVTQVKVAEAAIDEHRLSISNTGTNGQYLQKQSGNTGGLTWADAGGGGKILQVQGPVVSDTQYEVNSSTYSDTDLTDTITPEATSSKILVAFCLKTYVDTNNYFYFGIKVIRTVGGSDTTVLHDDMYHVHNLSAHVNIAYRRTIHVVDSPSTTSECTYKLQVARVIAAGSLDGSYLNGPPQGSYVGEEQSSILLMEIGA